MSKINWNDVPAGVQFYSDGKFRVQVYDGRWLEYELTTAKGCIPTTFIDIGIHKCKKDFEFNPNFKPHEPQNESPDMVNHPPHYQSDNGIECIDAIRAALGKDGFIAYCRGNAIKYSWRDKIDNTEDYKKAAWYLAKAVEESTTKV
jgi:hypothetical protein